jgi:hypothetical protein
VQFQIDGVDMQKLANTVKSICKERRVKTLWLFDTDNKKDLGEIEFLVEFEDSVLPGEEITSLRVQLHRAVQAAYGDTRSAEVFPKKGFEVRQ